MDISGHVKLAHSDALSAHLTETYCLEINLEIKVFLGEHAVLFYSTLSIYIKFN